MTRVEGRWYTHDSGSLTADAGHLTQGIQRVIVCIELSSAIAAYPSQLGCDPDRERTTLRNDVPRHKVPVSVARNVGTVVQDVATTDEHAGTEGVAGRSAAGAGAVVSPGVHEACLASWERPLQARGPRHGESI